MAVAPYFKPKPSRHVSSLMSGGDVNTREPRRFPIALVVIALPVLGWLIATQCGVREVRIDSGDRRIRCLFFSMPEDPVPNRESLIQLSKSLNIPAEWHRPPFTAPSYTDQDRYRQFSGAAWWAKHEPPLGAIILKQLVQYYTHPPAESGLPRATHFIFLLDWNRDRNDYEISNFWLQSETPETLQYVLDQIGYQPAAGSVVDGIMSKCRARRGEASQPDEEWEGAAKTH